MKCFCYFISASPKWFLALPWKHLIFATIIYVFKVIDSSRTHFIFVDQRHRKEHAKSKDNHRVVSMKNMLRDECETTSGARTRDLTHVWRCNHNTTRSKGNDKACDAIENVEIKNCTVGNIKNLFVKQSCLIVKWLPMGPH